MRPTLMRFLTLTVPLCLILGGTLGTQRLGAQEGVEENEKGGRARPNFWQAAAGVLATNGITWGYNRYVQRWPWSKVGTSSWAKNIGQGFTWDDNLFSVNQLAHPYHGSFYLGSARASGYNFWQSIPFVLAGSATWEFFGENIQPSINDLISTTLGGIAVGEVTYRLSSFWGGARGTGRMGRALGSFALNPMARSQSLVRHRSDRDLASMLDDGVRLAAGRYQGRAFFQLSLRSRSAFDPAARKPYDAFELDVQAGPPPEGLNRIVISGLLARRTILSGKDGLVLALYQHYDYEVHGFYKFGAQSLSGALRYRHGLGSRSQLDLGIHAEGVVLAGISSEYGNYWRRDYDLGPGVGARLVTRFTRDGLEWFRLDSRVSRLHSLHGSGANHIATSTRVTVVVPLFSSLAIGGDYSLMDRLSRYPRSPVYRRWSEVRGFLAWIPS